MTVWLKQSTAVTVMIGPFLDETDGKTAEVALTISQADVRLSKNAANMAQKADATACTHDELGHYTCPLSTGDTDTLGVLRLMVHESGALPVWQDFQVVPANVWDSIFGADKLQVHAAEITDGLITAAAVATGAIDADAIADNAIDAGAIATGAITAAKFAAGAIDAAAIAAGAIDNATFAADVGSTAYATNIIALAADKAIQNYDAPTKAELDSGLAGLNDLDAAGVRTAVGMASADLDTQLAALPTAAENADAVWDEAATGHTDAGKAGAQMWTDVDAILADTNELQTDWHDGGRLDLILDAAGSAGDPWATAIPGAYGAGTAGKILGDNVNAPIATVDTVVDAIKAKTDNLPTDPADQSAVEAAITAAHATTDAKVDAVDDYVDTEVAAIKAVTDKFAFTGAGPYEVKADVVDWKGSAAPAMTGDAYARLGAPAGASVSADIAAIEAQTDDIGAAGAGLTALPWNAAWDAEVESEATDAITAAALATAAELAKVPKSDSTVSWNATALAAIGLAVLNQALATSDADALNARTVRSALRALRNKTSIAAGTLTVTKEDDSTAAWTAAVTTDADGEPIVTIDPA